MVSLELRVSAVTDRADVVFPVAAVAEKAGTFVNWEGRPGTFGAALVGPGRRTDLQVLAALADEMDVHLGLPDDAAARRELEALGTGLGRPGAGTGPRAAAARGRARPGRMPAAAGAGQALLATWRNLLDAGRMQDGEPNLAGTARAAVARLSAATAAEAGTAAGGKVSWPPSTAPSPCRWRSPHARPGRVAAGYTPRVAASGVTCAPGTAPW